MAIVVLGRHLVSHQCHSLPMILSLECKLGNFIPYWLIIKGKRWCWNCWANQRFQAVYHEQPTSPTALKHHSDVFRHLRLEWGTPKAASWVPVLQVCTLMNFWQNSLSRQQECPPMLRTSKNWAWNVLLKRCQVMRAHLKTTWPNQILRILLILA